MKSLIIHGVINLKKLPDPSNETPCSKSPTRQSRYGDGALQGIPTKAKQIKPCDFQQGFIKYIKG
jgi:hypothetical protein